MSKLSASCVSARLIKSVSLLAIVASVAGCATGTERFSDGFYTGAVPKQSVGSAQTPFPSNTATQPVYQQPQYQAQQPVYAPTVPNTSNYGNVDRTYTASVPAQTSVQRQTLAAPQPVTAAAKPATKPAEKPAIVAAKAPATETKEGWTTDGGTYITMSQGETVDIIAKRYGVPTKAILESNGLSRASAVSAGTKIIIPTYVYAQSASKTVAKSSVASASQSVTNITPVPSNRPLGTQVASLAPKMAEPAAPQVVDSAVKSGKYAVASGDTLSKIASKTGTSIAGLKRLNGLSSDSLRIGQTLLIPGVDGNPTTAAVATATINKTTTAAKPEVAAYTPPKQEAKDSGEIAKIDNTSTASAPQATGVESMRWPVKGRVTSSFGSNVGGKGNDGIDISVPRGTSVKAAENGVVIYAGDGLKEFGQTVLVRHGNGLVTVYGHLDSISVERGANVTRGQSVGVSGMTGSAKQPQLHFEVRKNSSPVNPMTYLR